MAKPFRRAAPPLSTISQQAKSAARQKWPHSLALQATCQRASGHKTHRAPAAGARGRWAPGWFARLRWPWLPDASTRSLRGGLEAQLAARVTQKCWAERSVWSHCTSQGAFRVPSGTCSSTGPMARPYTDPCLGTGRPATTSQMFPVNSTALLLPQKLPAAPLPTPSRVSVYPLPPLNTL